MSPRSAILARSGVRSASSSKKRRRYWAASQSAFHSWTARCCLSVSSSERSRGVSRMVTYSGGSGLTGRRTARLVKPTGRFQSRGYSSGLAFSAVAKTCSRSHASTSATVAGRSSSASSAIGPSWVVVCVIPTPRQSRSISFRFRVWISTTEIKALIWRRTATRGSTQSQPVARKTPSGGPSR